MSSPHLEPRQLETLDKLVSIPSPSGQEQEILRFIEERLSGVGECRITKQRVDEERWNLIVQKGAQEGFTIMLYAHVDSVLRRSSWENDYRFDISADRQRARGVKVYDMGAGVMILMEIMQTVNVPDGIRVVSVFGVGEEAKSEGASELMKWEGMKHVDLILSPEIATLDREERDNPKDVVIARCGILKTWMHINVPGGHGYKKGVPNAIAAAIEIRNHLMEKFYIAKRRHALVGEEDFEEASMAALQGDGLEKATDAELCLRHFLVPGNSLAAALEWQMECARELARLQHWTRSRINFEMGQRNDRRSYEPFVVDTNSEVMEHVLRGVDHTFGGHVLVGGGSPADSNIFSTLNKPMAEIGPVGGDAHLGTEWVDLSSIARTLSCYKTLISQYLSVVHYR